MLNAIIADLMWETIWRILVVWITGSIALWYGRALVRDPERVRWIGDWIAIELARHSGREEIVAQREPITETRASTKNRATRHLGRLYLLCIGDSSVDCLCGTDTSLGECTMTRTGFASSALIFVRFVSTPSPRPPRSAAPFR